ncbi:MAG: TonB-dependent receptor domain-containing protein [Acidobacteriota bacterium]
MGRWLVRAFLTAGVVVVALPVQAQTGDGSLRGYVRDDQGGVLPGVTVTALSPALLNPVTSVTDSGGYYRLLNLPPGTYAITAELAGFATYRREGIIMRAGTTFSVDVQLKIGALEETVTVTGDSPMIETGRPTSVLNIDGELVRAAPVTSRRLFSDALDLAPGVGSRNVDDGVGRRAYYFRGSHIYAHAFQLEGAPASAYIDSAAHSMGMGGDTIQDVEIKLGGADASTPLSTGVVLNVVTPRGQNQLKGSVMYSFQPLDWNGDNTQGGAAPGGLPTFQKVNQWDVSLGGRIIRDRVWFYGTYRYADLLNGISRTTQDLAFLRGFRSDFEPFDNFSKSKQPFVKLTTQMGQHELSGYWQNDRNRFSSDRERETHQINPRGTGGSLYQVKLNSVWGNRLQTSFQASYNNKGGADVDTYENFPGFGPQVEVHQSTRISQGLPTGTGRLVTMNNAQTLSISPSSMLVLRGDLTYYKEGWAGSHELKTGIWAAPSLERDVFNRALNDGFVLERVRQRDPNNPAAGLVAFQRQFISPIEIQTTAARDRDIAFYVQDMWKPHPRLTINAGVRADLVRRFDDIFQVERMNSTNVGPRVGGAFLLTSDARNVVRAFYGRVHEQVNGRDPITTFGPTSRRLTRNIYDADGDGNFETEVITPAATAAINRLAFDSDLHQPFIDEYAVGFARQFPGQLSLDVSFNRRYFRDAYGEIDINGIYPAVPFQPFAGFGRVDPNQGMVMQQTNAAWSTVVVTNWEAILAKNLSRDFQVVLTGTRQFQHLDGTWNPTDPARFIQPDAFANNRDLSSHLFGNGDDNSLNGGGRESGVAYRPYSVRMAGQYFAPWDVRVSASYIIQAGGYLGPVVTQMAAGDPTFGPATIRLANGTTQPNPLATSWRFAYGTRSDGQVRNETARFLQLQLGRDFKFGDRTIQTSLGLFNLFNTGAHTQWNDGANRLNSPLYLSRFNRHPPRAYQLTVTYKF